MLETTDNPTVYQLRLLRKDLGVAAVVLIALALGWLLSWQVERRSSLYQEPDSSFKMAYPASWISADSLQDVLLKVEDPQTDSTFKSNLTIERRDLDPQSPPTLQALMDRRVEQRGVLTGYHFLSNSEAMVAGEKAILIEYAYVVQPIDAPRRASLPVVVRAREYIVLAKDRAYYLTLAAPEQEFERASQRFAQSIRTVQL